MKLIKKDIQPATAGLPESSLEWWDLDDRYEIYISVSEKSCTIGIDAPNHKDITFEVAKYLNIDTALEKIKFGAKPEGRELYLSAGIDCVQLVYRRPQKYKELLQKIETIVNQYFKHKNS